MRQERAKDWILADSFSLVVHMFHHETDPTIENRIENGENTNQKSYT
jgi:hypothetical protein